MMTQQNAALPLSDCLTDVSIREGSQQPLDLRSLSVAQKVELLELSCNAGVKSLEVTAFAPGEWFSDADDLVERALIKVGEGPVLKALYFNTVGLERLLAYPRLLQEGVFHTALTHNYREKNYAQRDTEHALLKMNRFVDAFKSNGLEFDTLLVSTAWGEKAEEIDSEQAIAFIAKFLNAANAHGLPVKSVTLADTVGQASPEKVATLVSKVRREWPELFLRAHLHPSRDTAEECVSAALESGISGWDAAWGGVGGSPYADKSGGNLDIRCLINVYQREGIPHGLNLTYVERIISWLRAHTKRDIFDL